MMQCQFCRKIFEDRDALQLHQVASCPAIEEVNRSVSFDDEKVQVVFKWLVDRVITKSSVHLIGSDMIDNIELKKGVGCYKSDKVLVTTGKYSGQLVIDNDVTPVNDFAVTLLSEVVHLIANKGASPTSPTAKSPPPYQVKGKERSNRISKKEISSGDQGLSPLHQELIDHQVQNDYDFGDLNEGNDAFGTLLREESVHSLNSHDRMTTHSPDFSQLSQLPRDSECEDSFYSSFATPIPFETIDPNTPAQSPPGTAGGTRSLYPNLKDVREMLDDDVVEPSLQSQISRELLEGELEDAMRDEDVDSDETPPFRSFTGVDVDDLEELVEEDIKEHNVSVDYAGNPITMYDEPSSPQHTTALAAATGGKSVKWKTNDGDGADELSVDYAGNPVHKLSRTLSLQDTGRGKLDAERKQAEEEMARMSELLENYKEVKVQLETKCASYDTEVERLTKRCIELEHVNKELEEVEDKCTQMEQALQETKKTEDDIGSKNLIIEEMKVNAASYESELKRLNEEVEKLIADVAESEQKKVELENKCEGYRIEVEELTKKCDNVECVLAENIQAQGEHNIEKEEVVKLTQMVEDLGNLKAELDAKCNSYASQNQKLLKNVEELQTQLQQVGSISEKDQAIAELSVKVADHQAEIDESSKEMGVVKEELEDYKNAKTQMETKCQKYEKEIRRLAEKCEEQDSLIVTLKDGDKTKSYKAEIKRLDAELIRALENVKATEEQNLGLSQKCEVYESQVQDLKDKYAQLETINENTSLAKEVEIQKEQEIGELKVQIESYETELDRLNQEVLRLTETNGNLDSMCKNMEEEVVNMRHKYNNRSSSQKTDELVKTYQDLERNFNELQASNQKLLQDYQGLEGSKIVYEEEVRAERERYETRIKELEDKTKMAHTKSDKHSENSARLNINRLKSENRLLREKLNLIRNESELDPTSTATSASKGDGDGVTVAASPRGTSSGGYKPPLVLKDHGTNYNTELTHAVPSTRRHDHNKTTEESTLPSRYIVSKYTSPERVSPSPAADRYTAQSNRERELESIMKRYSDPVAASPPVSVPRKSRSSRPNSYHETYGDLNGVDIPKSYSNYRSRSLDRLDSSGNEDAMYPMSSSAGKYSHIRSNLSAIPFCPTSVRDLVVGMKVSVNRANGRLSRGTVKWIGTLPRHSGDYVGVELDSEAGKHDGNLNGVQYFKCKGERGIFVKFPKVIMAWK